MTAKWAPSDERLKCKDCLGKAVTSAFENWSDDKGVPITESDFFGVMQWAVGYIDDDMTTPCEAHVAPEPEIVDLTCHPGCVMVGCAFVYPGSDRGWWGIECDECCSVLRVVDSRELAMELAIEHVKHTH